MSLPNSKCIPKSILYHYNNHEIPLDPGEQTGDEQCAGAAAAAQPAGAVQRAQQRPHLRRGHGVQVN